MSLFQNLGPPPEELVRNNPVLNRWFHDLLNIAVVYNGNGVPSNKQGMNGDLYLNNTGGAGTRLYGKIAGAWVAIA